MPKTSDPINSFVNELARNELPISKEDIFLSDEVTNKDIIIESISKDTRFLYFGNEDSNPNLCIAVQPLIKTFIKPLFI
jgi:hypothetical protein